MKPTQKNSPIPTAPSSHRHLPEPAQRATFVLEHLKKRYPVRETHLAFTSPWELLVATILSAQCTDARVNMVTPVLFAQWATPAAMAHAQVAMVEKVIHSTGFFRNKAKNIVAAAQRIMESYGGEVPATMADLVSLPGVARKTANVVLWNAFGKNEGIAVDTHVSRIVLRLGFTTNRDPERTEKVLMQLFPQREWGNVNHMLVWFGRHVCTARSPQCSACEMLPVCAQTDVHPV